MTLRYQIKSCSAPSKHEQNHASINKNVNISYQWSSTSVPQLPSIQLTKQRFYPGFIKEFQQPVLKLSLKLQTMNELQTKNLLTALAVYFPQIKSTEVILSLAEAITLLHQQCGFPSFESVKIETINDETIFYVPVLFEMCSQLIIELLLNLFNYHLKNQPETPHFTAQIENLVSRLKPHAPQGENSLGFLQAAFQLNIPWTHVSLNTFQFGYGRHSRWLNSTFTDQTSCVSAKLTENKRAISLFLKRNGFPLPEQVVVMEEAEAVYHAQTFGYPVVIKPIDRKGGEGVYANLMSPTTLKKACQQAKKISSTLLLEKHIPGKDYRALIVNGKMLWAVERIPAGVTGNGVETIQSLVNQHNHQHKHMYPLRYIDVTDDCIDYLHEQNLSLDSIIPSGKFIALNRIANICAGGTPYAVFDKIHPDNKRLMETAAQLLRLDIVGIDFISEDIAVSYTENNAKILEVNAQPQVGSTTSPYIFHDILKALAPARIPITLICGEVDFSLQNLYPHAKQIGFVKNNSAYINAEKIIDTASSFEAGKYLLARNDIDSLVYWLKHEDEIDHHGLPFDHYDQFKTV